MPRPKKPGSAEPKKRSRNGCWPCKNRKIKCGEERPKCLNCERQGETCDYSIRLNWEGRTKRKGSDETQMSFNTISPPPKIHRPSSQNVTGMGEASLNLQTSFTTQQYASPDSPGLPPFQRDHISTTQLSRIRVQRSGPYASPAESGLESPPPVTSTNSPNHGHHHSQSNLEMPPPFQGLQYAFPNVNNMRSPPNASYPDLKSKKTRLSPPVDAPDYYAKAQSFQPSNFAASRNLKFGPTMSPQPLRYQSSSPSNSNVRVPPTPGASSAGSEDIYQSMTGPSPQPSQESSDYRRLSVKSLLSDDSPADSGSGSEAHFPGKLNVNAYHVFHKTTYGIDRGFPDLDIPRNNDMVALNGTIPTLEVADPDNTVVDLNGDDCHSEFGFGLDANGEGFNGGEGYYASPVTVSISRSLEPLPGTLKDNPMNLLYFHHFVNHTARMLVPHDCSENPFKSILPQMAVHNPNLLNLLLTYSASHRSSLLNHPEPVNRIAIWVQDVFPSLRRALSDPSRQISNSNLATAIMLSSLEILNPNTFEVKVPWQKHLHIARQMILARGGANSLRRRDKVSYFLIRWFAYLDVMGSLSGGRNDRPLFSGEYWASDADDGQEYQIDCLLGFTSRCVSILAKIGELARNCEGERVDPTGNLKEDWEPSLHVREAAEGLKADLMEARMHRYQGCPHRRASTQIEDNSYNLELVTTNEAFHHAGLIHVNRRVLGKPSTDPEVQFAVREIVSALYKVRKGGTAEGCLLFPMFTAGCDARERSQRERIMERLKRMEGLGMSQVRKARALLEKVWETGRPWETLVTGEFFFG